MNSIYEFTNFRDFLNSWLNSKPNGGHGLRAKLATASNVSSTMMSQILTGAKTLTLDQGSELADYLGLNENETDYFFLLIELDRAANYKLEQKLKRRIKFLQNEATKLSKRIQYNLELSDAQKAIYYSSWIYAGIRNLIATGEFLDAKSISERLCLPFTVVNSALDFLIKNDICKVTGKKIVSGPAHIHIGSNSQLVSRHHQNWRLRGFTIMDNYNESNLFFTSPMSLSQKAAEEIRRMLPSMIEKIRNISSPSESEKVYCLNLDWFEY